MPRHVAFPPPAAVVPGTFSVDPGKMKTAVSDLTRELMTIEGHGDYRAAQGLLATAFIRPETQAVLDRLSGVPVDIEPRFTTAEQLTRRP